MRWRSVVQATADSLTPPSHNTTHRDPLLPTRHAGTKRRFLHLNLPFHPRLSRQRCQPNLVHQPYTSSGSSAFNFSLNEDSGFDGRSQRAAYGTCPSSPALPTPASLSPPSPASHEVPTPTRPSTAKRFLSTTFTSITDDL